MKDPLGGRDLRPVQFSATGSVMLRGLSVDAASTPRDAEAVYEDHAEFVWRSLQHLGARDADLEDLTQEVFVVVHRSLGSFDGRSRLTTWLFGICLNLVRRHRRRAYFRFERVQAEPPERVDLQTPERRYAGEEAKRRLDQLLVTLSPERRATFLLFEVDGASCEEIAELTCVPVGTVYSRLHSARKEVSRAAARLRRAAKWEEP